jgi:chromosome segregation ATPase
MKNKNSNDKTTMTAREVVVLIEGLRSEFKLFGDGLKMLIAKVEALEATVARVWEKVTQIDLRLIRVEKKIVEIDERLKSAETDTKETKEAIKTHSEKLSHLETLK